MDGEKNLKKALILVGIVLLATTVAAISKPEPNLPFNTINVFSIPPPPPPVDTECLELYSTSNSRCSGNIRLYDYCAPGMPTWCDGADFDHDGVVGVMDLGSLQENYDRTDCNLANNWCNKTDINQDGKVNILELDALGNSYGRTDCGTPTGLIEARSENCADYGSNWACQNNDCIEITEQPSPQQETSSAMLLIILAAIGYFLLFRKKKGGKK